jgi:hypothetical protein
VRVKVNHLVVRLKNAHCDRNCCDARADDGLFHIFQYMVTPAAYSANTACAYLHVTCTERHVCAT